MKLEDIDKITRMKIDQIKFSVVVVFFCSAAYFLVFDSVSSGKSVGLLHF